VARNGTALVRRDADHPLELFEVADAITVLPPPIVPLSALHTGEMALAKLVARGADHETRFCPSQLDWRGKAMTVEFSKS
jgi:hypothetical protein